jgi:histidyl-tRNA synthetase
LQLGAAIGQSLGEDREAYAKARERVQRQVPRGEMVAVVREIFAMQ